jgi:hypothetical protein
MSKIKQSVGCGQCGHPTGPAGCTGACFNSNLPVTPIRPDELTYSDVRAEEKPDTSSVSKAQLDDLWAQVEYMTEQLKDDPTNQGLAKLLSNTVATYNAKLKQYDSQSRPWTE